MGAGVIPECLTPTSVSLACVCAQSLSSVQFFCAPWTVAHQAPLSMGFPRQEYQSFHSGSAVKESTCNAGDVGSILRSGRSPGEGNGNPLQYSCLENPMDRGAWQATGHRISKNVGHN